ncbi:STAS domain-containing protein [Streptomyces sp. NPDC001415]
MTQRPPPLTRHLHTYRTHGHTVLEFHGEIDMAAATEFIPRLDAAIHRPEPLVVIDLTPVTFLDCSGLGLLCRAHHHALLRHGSMRLVCNYPPTLRLLHLARLTSVFRPVPSLHDALPGPMRPFRSGRTPEPGSSTCG